jgi:hypothetical protein
MTTIARIRADNALRFARRKFGDFHPATFAAYARAFVAWEGRVRPPSIEDAPNRAALAHAYTTAQLRAYGDAGYDNRARRAARTDDLTAAMTRAGARLS